MKKALLLVLLSSSFTVAFSNIIKITVSDYQFTSKNANAKVGDTILWIWKTGSHTTTSTNVPAGASQWNSPIDATHKKFGIIVTQPGTYQYKCIPHNASGMNGTINVSRTLSAGLTDFSINEDNANALLSWKTSSAKDVAYFSVQRSSDGETFTEVSRVTPSSGNVHSFKDNNYMPGKYVYYQIEMVDTKGEKQLTEIRMFTQNITSKLITSLSPNPVSSPGHLMLQFNADKEGVMLVQLYNGSGTFVKQTEMSANRGLNNGHFHLGDLTPGAYYIVCTLGTIKEKHTIMVK